MGGLPRSAGPYLEVVLPPSVPTLLWIYQILEAGGAPRPLWKDVVIPLDGRRHLVVLPLPLFTNLVLCRNAFNHFGPGRVRVFAVCLTRLDAVFLFRVHCGRFFSKSDNFGDPGKAHFRASGVGGLGTVTVIPIGPIEKPHAALS